MDVKTQKKASAFWRCAHWLCDGFNLDVSLLWDIDLWMEDKKGLSHLPTCVTCSCLL